MAFKPITLAGFAQFQACIAEDHDGHTLSQADRDIVSACFQSTFVEEEPEPIPPEPPPLGPPPGSVLYQSDFSQANPFQGWYSRFPGNVTVQTEGGNKFCRLRWNPHSGTRISFLPRFQGVFKCRVEFALRFPRGFDFATGGGKHIWMLQACNQLAGENLLVDGECRLDFGAWEPFSHWQAINYRCEPGGSYHTAANKHYNGFTMTPDRWHQIRLDCRLNAGKGDDSGHMVLSKDGQIEGELRGEFNIIGTKGGMRVLGFGNVDNLVENGSDYFDVDNIRVTAL